MTPRVTFVGDATVSGATLLVFGLILSLFLVVGCVGYIDATWIHRNDLFDVASVMVFGMFALDFISDIFFAVSVFTESDGGWFYTFMTIAAIFFLIIPLIVNLIQLKRAIPVWIGDAENGVQLMVYLDLYVNYLYALAVVTGSGFAAVNLLNSELYVLSLLVRVMLYVL